VEVLDVLATGIGVIQDVGNDSGRVMEREHLELLIERGLLLLGPGGAGGVENLVHFGILVVPQRRVPGTAAVEKWIDRSVDRRAAVEAVGGEGGLWLDLRDELVPRHTLPIDVESEGLHHLAAGKPDAPA